MEVFESKIPSNIELGQIMSFRRRKIDFIKKTTWHFRPFMIQYICIKINEALREAQKWRTCKSPTIRSRQF